MLHERKAASVLFTPNQALTTVAGSVDQNLSTGRTSSLVAVLSSVYSAIKAVAVMYISRQREF
jgi:hypothetical protein